MSGMWIGKQTPHGIFGNGSKINLKPRSFHIMFIDLTKSFNKTSYQKVKFNFENAGSIIINMPIINKAKISKDKKKNHHH